MTPQQRFLLLLILVGALATVLGLVSVALALSVADVAGVDNRVSLIAYGVVLLSLLVQGGLITPVTRIFKIETPA
jgi:NhaP-type Na+/H+ or K+/H+ antiporter